MTASPKTICNFCPLKPKPFQRRLIGRASFSVWYAYFVDISFKEASVQFLQK